ncbi:hypothetical protein F4803DRAFT_428227 [Xylaria telfairii]|nr:hypothetical protein F4803DRAFT_428227 [Xylaria telfairii]
MVSLIRPRAADHGLLAVKSSSPRATSSGGHGGACGSASSSISGRNEPAVMKPWADQPWPLIETPSRSQPITHPALHIANEIAHIHNAMLRGLNAIYLQAPYVQQAQDIADLSFLTQSWSTWLLDHHSLKESTMLSGFEAVLGVPAGTLTLPCNRSPSAASFRSDRDMTAMEVRNGEGDEELISFLLHRVYACASTTHKDPAAYDATTLRNLLVTLANTLVPHLTDQVGLLVSMREMCFGSSATSSRNIDIPAPHPMPMVTITRTGPSNRLPSSPGSPSVSPPISPSSSTFSASASIASASSSSHSPPTVSLSLFPPSSTMRVQHRGKNGNKHNSPSNQAGEDMSVIDTEAKDRLARARARLEADDRATRLTQVYLAADARASAKMDHFVVLPMIVRLREVTTAPALSRTASFSQMSMDGAGMGIGMGGGGGGNGASEWPRMSIPAVHAIADKLSPRHEGAWRFLPCDVWGRPRELPFLGCFD